MENLLKLAIFVSAVFLVVGQDTSNCPAAVARNEYLDVYNGRCYEFVIFHESYWDDAQNDCAKRGGNLVSVTDEAKQDYLVEMLQTLKFDKHGIWIGFNDRANEDNYVWASGLPTNYTNWSPGEPSLFRGVEDCVLMKSTNSFMWEDHPCHLWPQHYTYICEYEMVSSTTTRTPVFNVTSVAVKSQSTTTIAT